MIIPVNGGVLVKKVELKTKGSILLPDGVGKNEPKIAEVIATSEDYVQNGVVRKTFVTVGDKVIYNPLYAIPFEVDGAEQTLVYITNIIATIKE